MEPTRIRLAQESDLEAIVEIYNHYVRTTPITFDVEPYSVATRRPWFEAFATSGRYRLLVAERAGRMLGYAGTTRFRDKRAYDTTVEMTIYLRAEASRSGVGAALYRDLFESVRGEDIHRLVAGITVPNDASIALHRRFGFREVGVFREVGRKLGRYWDVAWYERPLDLPA